MNLQQPLVAGANAGRARSHNRQVVLGHVRRAGHIGRAEIARASGLSTQAVSNIIADLSADGLLVEQGRLSAGRGLPAVQYALNPAGGYALGVEVRPDVVFATVLDLTGGRVFAERRALGASDPATITAQVVGLRDAALADLHIAPQALMGAGIVMPGPFGTAGPRDQRSELVAWRDIDAQEHFSGALGLTVQVENDANAAAMAERINGAAKGLRSYAYLYFGAGLGLGIVSEGQLFRGAFGNAGEIGQIVVPGPDGPVVLEQAVSRVAAQADLATAGLTVASVQDLDLHHRAGHPAMTAWLERAAGPLSHAVALIENLFDPEAVILGGAMPDGLLDDLISRVALSPASVSHRPDRGPRLLRGASGRMTAALGAGALVLNDVFTPQITA